jgi:hypothetical protein
MSEEGALSAFGGGVAGSFVGGERSLLAMGFRRSFLEMILWRDRTAYRRSARSSGRWDRSASGLEAQETGQREERKQN